MSAAARIRPLRVVIIDDTADLRELLQLALRRGGYDVVAEAGDGLSGIEAVRAERPDLILLDLSMPIMDGLEALPAIRRSCPTAKIVVLSGFGATQMSERAMASGADGYVQKGASLDSILDYVRDVTAGVPTSVPRSLSVVPPLQESESLALASHAPALEPETGTANGSPLAPGSHVSSWQALSMAPMGIIELSDEPLLRIVYANPTAQRLLVKRTSSGTPLGFAAAQLASLVAFHRLDADASFEVELEGGTARATLRRTGWSLLVYLDSTSDDVALLRRAIATTAHEIRGPVAVICGIAEASGWDGAQLTDAQRERLMTSVARQARMLDSITADLLTAAQIQRGTLRVDLTVLDPRAIIESVVNDRYGVQVEVIFDDDRLVRADPLRLEQMVTNLLGNALKYGGAPYTIHVRPDDDHVAIDVVDRGEGVPEEFRTQLFGEFSRANGTVATGTGLGLYVTRTLAEAQNGTVTYRPGQYGGSVFTISLAAVEQPLSAPPMEGAGGPAA
ncbi:MAG: response regulator [Actinobacteria bacterium]|uniref:histidine kinase n=1 Tax=freshwater metagenome TaxID=449393 RepID=A0A6J6PU81_9ZZZZ|nr:response regulator [Actinomycetota bacterium]